MIAAAELSSDSSDQDHVDTVSDVTADTVYSNLANLLTALQSAHPAGHCLDTCPVKFFSVYCQRLLLMFCIIFVYVHTVKLIMTKQVWTSKFRYEQACVI